MISLTFHIETAAAGGGLCGRIDLLVDQATAAAAAAAAAAGGGDPAAAAAAAAHHHTLTNGGSIVDAKTGQTVLTSSAAAAKSHFNSIGALHLTQEECNEILIKRAIAAGQGHQTHHTLTHAGDGAHHHHTTAPGTTPSKHLKSVLCSICSSSLSLSVSSCNLLLHTLRLSLSLSVCHSVSLSVFHSPILLSPFAHSLSALGYTGYKFSRFLLLFFPPLTLRNVYVTPNAIKNTHDTLRIRDVTLRCV